MGEDDKKRHARLLARLGCDAKRLEFTGEIAAAGFTLAALGDPQKMRKIFALLLLVSTVFAAPPPGEHDYYMELLERPDVWIHRAYSSAEGQSASEIQSDIDADRRGGESAPVNVYDPELDAARLQFVPNEGDVGQQRLQFPSTKNSGNLFLTWEVRWDQYWESDRRKSSRDGISTHKSVQIRSAPDFDLHIEVRTLYRDFDEMNIDESVPAGVVGFVDIREYLGSSDTLWPVENLYPLPAEAWVRYFMWLDWDTDTISLWVDDATQPMAVIYDRARDSGGEPLNGGQRFDYEFDSSQDRSGPETFIWVRNLVVLKDLSGYAEAKSLVANGAI